MAVVITRRLSQGLCVSHSRGTDFVSISSRFYLLFLFSTPHTSVALTRMLVPATHSGTISSILGMTLKISHRTMKKLLKCSGFFEVVRCEFLLLFFFLLFFLPCQCVTQSFCYLWTFSPAIRGESSHRHKHNMTEICIIKVHLMGWLLLMSYVSDGSPPTEPPVLARCDKHPLWMISHFNIYSCPPIVPFDAPVWPASSLRKLSIVQKWPPPWL